MNFLKFLDKLEQAMCEIFAINAISQMKIQNGTFNYQQNQSTTCVFVEHNVYVVAKLLISFFACFEFSTWVLTFRVDLYSRVFYISRFFLQSLKTRN